MINKKTYTKIFLKQADKSIDAANVELHLHTLWYSRRSKKKGGLRLSDKGYEFLVRDLELHEHEVPFTEQIELSPNVIIFLDQYLDCPYYLTHKSLIVFSEKAAFKLHMFSDDIRKFGLIKAMNARKEDNEDEENT
jgi:hypothetical protein